MTLKPEQENRQEKVPSDRAGFVSRPRRVRSPYKKAVPQIKYDVADLAIEERESRVNRAFDTLFETVIKMVK